MTACLLILMISTNAISKPPVNSMSAAQMQQDTKTVKGKVTDSKGEPLPGVSILVKNKAGVGATTDIDGNFTILAKSDDVLSFMFLGFDDQEVKVGNSTELKIVMKEQAQTLDDVVVTGYQKTDRRLFAGAADKVKAEDAKLDGIADVSRMLEGKVAGVSVQNVSGTFGAAPKIRVRGASSIYGDTKPLWVVDGVVLEDVIDVSPDQLSSGDVSTLISSSVAGISAEDIESFQILKDASATALYGARAMNGVIVITTKNGSAGKMNIDVKSELSFRLKPNYNQYDIMNSQDQMSVFREMERKGWLGHSDMMRSKDGGVFFQMYDAINSYNEGGEYGLMNTPEARAEYLRKYERINTDWFDLLFRPGLQQNHSVNMRGGSNKANFFASTSYLKDEGWTIADKVQRFTINMKGNFNINDKLTVGISTKGSYRDQLAPGTFERENNPVTGGYSRKFDINPFSYALNTSRTIAPYEDDGSYRYNRMNFAKFNILEEFRNNYVNLDMIDWSLQGNIDYKFNKLLSYSFIGNIRYVKSTTEHMITANSNVSRAYRAADDATIQDNNPFLWKDVENPNERPMVVLPKGGFYNRQDYSLSNYYFRNVLDYKQIFGGVHSLSGMIGQELRSADRRGSGFEGYGIQYDKGNTVYTDPNIIKRLSQGGFPYFGLSNSYDRFVAFFVNGAYSYKAKYIVNATARLDGSNRLGSSRKARWLPTWNISGRWNVLQEDFMANVSDVISNLNIRATYGLTASMGPATNSHAVFRSNLTVAPFPNEVQNGMVVSSLQNSELTWEKQYEANLGIDFGIYDNVLSISADAYTRNGFDLIALIRTGGIGGESLKLANYADMVSRGFEFSLNSRNITGKNFNWVTNLTFAYNYNKIVNLYGQPSISTLTRAEGAAKLGGPVRGLYSIPFAGLNSEGIPTYYDKDGNVTTDIFFQDTQTSHLKYEGSIDPKITGGISNRFSYKNLTLNVFINYQFGNVIRLFPSISAQYSDLDAMSKDFKNRWLMSGDEKVTNIPTILSLRQYQTYGSGMLSTYNAYNYSDVRVAKGDFIRLKEISLNYMLPQMWAKKIGLSAINLKATGTNLWLMYSDKRLNGQDPEFFGAGGVALPTPKQFTFSLLLSL